jgi:hypothetical protein
MALAMATDRFLSSFATIAANKQNCYVLGEQCRFSVAHEVRAVEPSFVGIL